MILLPCSAEGSASGRRIRSTSQSRRRPVCQTAAQKENMISFISALVARQASLCLSLLFFYTSCNSLFRMTSGHIDAAL